MKKRRPKTWISGSALKPVRNARIIAARDEDKLSWPKIGRKFGISHQRAIAVYQREMRRRAEAGEAAA